MEQYSIRNANYNAPRIKAVKRSRVLPKEEVPLLLIAAKSHNGPNFSKHSQIIAVLNVKNYHEVPDRLDPVTKKQD